MAEEARSTRRQGERLLLLGLVPAAALLTLAARPILSLFGSGYMQAEPVLAFLVIGNFAWWAIASLSTLWLQYTNRGQVVVVVTLATLALDSLLNTLLIPCLGIRHLARPAVCPGGVGDGEEVPGRNLGRLTRGDEGVARADPARQVELARDQVLPHALERLPVAGRSGPGRDIRHAGVEVGGPDRVADHPALGGHRLVVLPGAPIAVDGAGGVFRVGLAVVLAAPPVEEESGQVEGATLAGGVRQLDERQLHLLVAGHVVAGVLAEVGVDPVGEADRHVEQGAVAGGAPVGDGRLDQVAGVVELVASCRDVDPALDAQARCRVLRVDAPGGHEVAVRLLGGGDQVDELLHLGRELRVVRPGESVGGGFQRLVDVRVVEAAALVRTLDPPGGALDVRDPPRLPVPVEDVGDGDGAVRLQARTPKLVREVNLRQVHGADLEVLPDGGHFAPLERPRAWAQRFLGWSERARASA